jgi:tryptophan halogenase
MTVPDTLQRKIDLYRSRGRIFRDNNELFAEVGWLQVMHGQGLRPERHNPVADLLPEDEVLAYLKGLEEVIARCVDAMPRHADFIAKHCAAPAL